MEKVVRILSSCSLPPASRESVPVLWHSSRDGSGEGLGRQRGAKSPGSQRVNALLRRPLRAQWLTLPPIVSPLHWLLHLSLLHRYIFSPVITGWTVTGAFHWTHMEQPLSHCSIVTIRVPLVLSAQHEQEILYLHNTVVGAVVRHNWNQEEKTDVWNFPSYNLPVGSLVICFHRSV